MNWKMGMVISHSLIPMVHYIGSYTLILHPQSLAKVRTEPKRKGETVSLQRRISVSRLRKYHILVIDDDKETLKLLNMALGRKKFQVTTASTWVEVINAVKQSFEDKNSFDAIVLDLMMPDRSGFDVLVSLQAMLVPLPPIVVLSAVTDIRKQVEASELGVSKYLTKPTTPSKLVQILYEVLDAQQLKSL